MSSLLIKKWLVQLREVVCSPYAIIAICGVMGYVAYTKIRRRYVTFDDKDYHKEGHDKQPVPLKDLKLTRKQLAEYNSKRADKTYLVALHDVIYDVSSGAKYFAQGRKYASLPGTEITGYIKEQARLKGRRYEEGLNQWKCMLEDIFYRAGKLIDDAKKDKADSVPEEYDDELDQQDGSDVELGSQDSSSCETCSDGESPSTALRGTPGRDDRTEVDRVGDRNRNGIDFCNENDATIVASS